MWTKTSFFAFFALTVAPNITDSFQSYNVLVDRDVMLYCDVTGFPDPEIEWFINNEAISPNNIKYSIDESTGSLEILSLSVEDTAIYECRASNPAGLATGEFEINVVGTLSDAEDVHHCFTYIFIYFIQLFSYIIFKF